MHSGKEWAAITALVPGRTQKLGIWCNVLQADNNNNKNNNKATQIIIFSTALHPENDSSK
jgi:hypothetical protein